jgi:hypothetical protein
MKAEKSFYIRITRPPHLSADKLEIQVSKGVCSDEFLEKLMELFNEKIKELENKI